MKTNCILSSLLVLLALALLSLSGCDTESAQSSPDINPSSATIKYGQSLRFTASGGYEYKWSLQNESWGSLSTRTGDSTVYTSLYNPSDSNSVIQILTLTSRISGTPESTNNVSYERTTEAYISHVSTNG